MAIVNNVLVLRLIEFHCIARIAILYSSPYLAGHGSLNADILADAVDAD
jgi:hypothetical protein